MSKQPSDDVIRELQRVLVPLICRQAGEPQVRREAVGIAGQ
jgi:hypothetical protein